MILFPKTEVATSVHNTLGQPQNGNVVSMCIWIIQFVLEARIYHVLLSKIAVISGAFFTPRSFILPQPGYSIRVCILEFLKVYLYCF